MSEIRIIYKTGGKFENNIREYIRKEGVWVLFGKKDGMFESLQVGKCMDVGYEIIYDIGCMQNLQFKSGTKKYINEFGEYYGLKYEEGIVQEYLYPFIKKQKYDVLMFIYVCDKNDENKEKLLAWLTHAKYWRETHAPFKREVSNRYEELKSSRIGLQQDCAFWKNVKDIMTYLENIKWE